jgi:hypothetical protein
MPTACTFLLDHDKEQCSTDGDCRALGPKFAGNVCDPAKKVCIASADFCTTNAQCIDANGAENFICDKAASKCKNLYSQECPRHLGDKGDLRNDEVIIFGFPWLSAEKGGLFKAGEDAVELARRDLKAAAGGIPAVTPGGAPRPLVWLVCDHPDQNLSLKDLYNRDMDVLIDRIGVPLMFGALTADEVQIQVNRGTPKDTLLFSNVAQFPSILNVPGARGLVFSFYPALDDATRAFAATAGLAETKLRAEGVSRDIKVMVALQVSPVTQSTLGVLKQSLRFNGGKTAEANGDKFSYVGVGNFGQPTIAADVAKAVPDVEAFDPDIIVCPSVSDCGNLYTAYEAKHAGRAFWIVNEVMENTDGYVKSAIQQKHMLGVYPGMRTEPDYASTLRAYFALTFPDDFTQSPFVGLYDFGFLAAILAAGVQTTPITGRAMGQVMLNQIKKNETVITPGLDHYQEAFAAIRQGKKISVMNNIEFDADGQGKFDALELFCPSTADKGYTAKSAGLRFMTATGTLEGTLSCAN